MRKEKGDLTRAERLEISILLEKKYSLRSIGRVLGRSPNTISYEVRENSVCGRYDPLKADQKARTRKHYRRFQYAKIEEHPMLKAYIIARLTKHWNPDEIAGDMRRRELPFYVSKTAIYDWLRTPRGERYCALLYSKRKRVKKRKPRVRRVTIQNRVAIAARFAGAANRTRYGHFERDTLVSKRGGTGGIAVHQERKSRLLIGKKVHTMRPTEHAHATRAVGASVVMKSATADNGLENRNHEHWGMPTFFCDPYSSWQKGGVENANKMLRRYFPKGTDFSTISQRDIDRVCAIINSKPRKILGYRSALEVALEAKIIKNMSVLTVG